MIVATEDAEALWFEIFYNSLGIGTDNMCAINTNNQKNNPFSNASSVQLFINSIKIFIFCIKVLFQI